MRYRSTARSGPFTGPSYTNGDGPPANSRVSKQDDRVLQISSPNGEFIWPFASPDTNITNCAVGINIIPSGGSTAGNYHQGPTKQPVTPPTTQGGYLITSWNGDLISYKNGMTTDTRAFVDLFLSGTKALLDGSGINIRLPQESLDGGYIYRVPGWARFSTGAKTAGTEITWAYLTRTQYPGYPHGIYTEDIYTTFQTALYVLLAGRVERTDINGLAPGGWVGEIAGGSTITPSLTDSWSSGSSARPIVLFGKYAGEYVLDCPIRYSGLTTVVMPNNVMATVCGEGIESMIVSSVKGETSDPDFVGRAAGQMICPINSEDVNRLKSAGRIWLAEGTKRTVWQ